VATALGERVQFPGLVDERLGARSLGRPPGEHERHPCVLGGKPLEQPSAVLAAAGALDPVPAGVALGQLAADSMEDVGMLVDRDDDRQRHAGPTLPDRGWT